MRVPKQAVLAKNVIGLRFDSDGMLNTIPWWFLTVSCEER
jgi:hypothetical protein